MPNWLKSGLMAAFYHRDLEVLRYYQELWTEIREERKSEPIRRFLP